MSELGTPESSPCNRHSSTWQKLGQFAIGVAEVAGIAVFSMGISGKVAEMKAVELAVVHDDTGPLPATIKAAPDYSAVDLGFPGAFYNRSDKFTKQGVGAYANVRLPDNFYSELRSGKLDGAFEAVIGIYHDPREAANGYALALQNEIERLKSERQERTAVVLFTILSTLGIATKNKGRLKQLGVVGGAAAMLGGGIMGLEVPDYFTWMKENEMSSQQYTISGLEGTYLEGTTASTPLLVDLTENAEPAFKHEGTVINEANAAFFEKAKTSIDEQLANSEFVPPTENQTLVITLADLHSNEVMVDIYTYFMEQVRAQYGDEVADRIVFVLPGDESYGSTPEIGIIKRVSKLSKYVIAIEGNHTSKVMSDAMREMGIIVLDGKTYKLSNGVSFLGNGDPLLSAFGSIFSLPGTTAPRATDSPTEQEAGKALLEEAKRTNPTVEMAHEPAEQEAAIGTDEGTFDSVVDEGNVDALPPQYAALELSGHKHALPFSYVVVPKVGGGYTVIADNPSSGGVPRGYESGGLPPFWWLPPRATASAPMFTIDNQLQQVVTIQELLTPTDGYTKIVQHKLGAAVSDFPPRAGGEGRRAEAKLKSRQSAQASRWANRWESRRETIARQKLQRRKAGVTVWPHNLPPNIQQRHSKTSRR